MTVAERAAAQQELQAFAEALQALQAPQIRAAFTIGSFPGGYFRPGQSDLDVVIILAGSPPQDAEARAEEEQLRKAVQAIAQAAKPFELEAMFVYGSQLMRDPHTGLLPAADIASRLLVQSARLCGEFDLQQVEPPLPQDFLPNLADYWQDWQQKVGQGVESAMPVPILVKHLFTLLRYFLIIRHQHVQYNKLQLLTDYQRLAIELPLPAAIQNVLEKTLQGETIPLETEAAFRHELPAFEQALIRATLPAKPE